MRRFLIMCVVLVGFADLVAGIMVVAQDKPPALTEVQSLRLELHQAHVQIAQLQLQLSQAQLAMERQAVTLDVLKDKPGYEIDWQSLTLKKTEPPKPVDPKPVPPKKE